MSRFNKFLNGERVPMTQFDWGTYPPPVSLNPDEALQMGIYTVSTGKAESEWLGGLLIRLSAESGRWHGVPWRMLRNEFLRFGTLKRLVFAGVRNLPMVFLLEYLRDPRETRS